MPYKLNAITGKFDYYEAGTVFDPTSNQTITGVWEFRPLLYFGDGTDTHIIKAFQEPGAGGQLRIGLDTDRMLVVADAADVIANVDFGLTAAADPTLYIMDAAATSYLKAAANTLYSTYAATFTFKANGITFQIANDKTSGNSFAFTSPSGRELTDTNAEQSWVYIEPKYNGANTSPFNGLQIKQTETLLGTGGANLIKAGSSVTDDFFKVDNTGGIHSKGGQYRARIDAGAADYNPSAATSDFLICADNTLAARAITISTEDVNSGSTAMPRHFLIKDEYGQAASNNLTISLESGTIDGAATAVLSGAYNAIQIYVDGTNGFIY